MTSPLVALLEGAIGLADRAGIERTLRLGRGVGRVWSAVGGPRARRVDEQLALAFPELSAAERRRRRNAVFAHLGQGLAEALLLAGRHRGALLDRVRVEGLEHLEAARRGADGRGVLVIGPHLGNWELGGARLASLGVPIALVYRGLRQPALERAIQQVRAGRAAPSDPGAEAVEQIPMGPRAGVRLVRALSSGRNVLVLLDQRARSPEGLVVEFFGRPARTRAGPLKLADRVGAPVLVAAARREDDGRHHRVTLHPPLQLEAGASDDEEVLRRNLQRVTTALEHEIRSSPEQWIWTHGRWRGAQSTPAPEDDERTGPEAAAQP